MKKTIRILSFLSAQATVVLLAVFIGWHLGPRANLETLRNVQEENRRLEKDNAHARYRMLRELFQTVARIQDKGQDEVPVNFLNIMIDRRLIEETGWGIIPGEDGFIFMPPADEWYWVAAAIGEYRDMRPSQYMSPEMESSMHRVFEQAKMRREELTKERESNK